jgi:hypothetical protein
MKTHPLLTVLVCTLVALLLLQQLHWAGQRLLAEFWAIPAVAKLEWWDEWDIDPGDAEWQPVHARFQAALRHMPYNPTLLSNMGRLYNIRLDDESLDEQEHDEAGALAIDYYQQVLALRPTWPWDWGNLTMLKYRLFLYEDSSYVEAFRTTARLGMRREDVALLLTELGLDTWSVLDEETRRVLAAIIDTESQRQPDKLSAILQRYPRWTRVCPYLVTPCLELE